MKSDFEAFEVLTILEGIKGFEFGNIKETFEIEVSHVTGGGVISPFPGAWAVCFERPSRETHRYPFQFGRHGGHVFILAWKI